ncbi:hypothetical protein U1Q18_048552 [Sarracenia purpurea var. burkii]
MFCVGERANANPFGKTNKENRDIGNSLAPFKDSSISTTTIDKKKKGHIRGRVDIANVPSILRGASSFSFFTTRRRKYSNHRVAVKDKRRLLHAVASSFIWTDVVVDAASS